MLPDCIYWPAGHDLYALILSLAMDSLVINKFRQAAGRYRCSKAGHGEEYERTLG